MKAAVVGSRYHFVIRAIDDLHWHVGHGAEVVRLLVGLPGLEVHVVEANRLLVWADPTRARSGAYRSTFMVGRPTSGRSTIVDANCRNPGCRRRAPAL